MKVSDAEEEYDQIDILGKYQSDGSHPPGSQQWAQVSGQIQSVLKQNRNTLVMDWLRGGGKDDFQPFVNWMPPGVTYVPHWPKRCGATGQINHFIYFPNTFDYFI